MNPHGKSFLGKKVASAKLISLSHMKWTYQFPSGCTTVVTHYFAPWVGNSKFKSIDGLAV